MTKAAFKFRGRLQMEEANVDPKSNSLERNGTTFSIDNLNLDAPVSGTVYGTLLNYKGALAALGDAVHEAPYLSAPKAPILYMKPINTLTGYGMPIPLPADVTELEIGAALGVVIGRHAARISEQQAWDYIAGYTIVNDVSVPHTSVYRPPISQKARDGFCPIGPWVIERNAVTDPDQLGLRVFINGELRQENNTRNLIRPVARLIADITQFMTLHAGDVLLVGVPEHPPLAKSGDRIRIEIDSIGSLENILLHEEELKAGGWYI